MLKVIADHPRTRGVYGGCPAADLSAAGSSPHARGLPGSVRAHPRCPGIIPARAGFTAQPYAKGYAGGDHPRTRGVYVVWGVGAGRGGGSSPHARGLLDGLGLFSVIDGIIPARAGFTRGHNTRKMTWWDHPRTRGVYNHLSQETLTRGGSSPHTRGLRRCAAGHSGRQRIIPAHAGFTLRV